ncbi:MAG: O-antigen ligase family protein [Phycisphaerae bacterium]|nr:O-antigen ligase family protein [Phycisphaerae bacterium]
MTLPRAERLARWSGVTLILFSALARVLTSQSRIPYWDIDPLTTWTPDTTRTPATSLLFDSLVWLAASMIIWAEGRAGRVIAWKTGLLALMGCAGIALHGWILTPLTAIGGSPPPHGDFQSMLLGSAWASAIVGAWALSMAAREPDVKRAAATALLGVVIVLAARGAMQVFIEHPRLVEDFNAKKDEMLAAQGFQQGSVSARLFERRLLQSEATGWFGLANVYGSFMAAGTAAFFALSMGATRAAKRSEFTSGQAGLLWLATAAAATGLSLSQSKGAVAAGLLGCFCVLLATWLAGGHTFSPHANTSSLRHQTQRWLRWSPIALPLLAILAVIARGLLGERLHELSLYFRWQYLLGAARIVLAHPLFGTGPAGFKDQYLLFKEPTNPEEIDSPHCLPMDWLATLGIFGAAWVTLWIVWLWRSGTPARDPRHEPPARTHPNPAAIAIIMGAPLAFSIWTERATYLPESLIIVMLAALAWWFIARAAAHLAATDDRTLDVALFGAAIVLATHCMIEVTGVMASSVAWAILVAALAGTKADRATVGAARFPTMPIVACASAFLVTALTSQSTFRTESALKRSALAAASVYAPSRTGPDPQALDRAIQELPIDAPWCSDDIRHRLRLIRAAASNAKGFELAQLVEESALALDIPARTRLPRAPATWTRAAGTLEFGANLMQSERDLRYAARAWLKVAELDPHGLAPPLRLARLYERLSQPDQASRWARRALAVHANLPLDPLKGLTDTEKAEMEHLAGRTPDSSSNDTGHPTPP